MACTETHQQCFELELNEKVYEVDEIKSSSKSIDEALQHYGTRFGKQEEEELVLGFNRKAFPWTQAETEAVQELTSGEAHSQLEKDLGLEQGVLREDPQQVLAALAQPASDADAWRVDDSDGEELHLCCVCKLPLGDVLYKDKKWCSDSKEVMHGECKALNLIQQARAKEEVRQRKEKLKKQTQHEEYGIDWKADHIPRNQSAASKLAMRDIPQGMVCLVADDEARSIRVAATVEPAAAVNLEYLSLALQVRRLEGHEPIFSLEPVDPSDKESMQEKVFMPEWLAGTSVGDVLFQSDYHLKELSMGEHTQPVVGMKSCFDYSEMENGQEWSAREWFVVRKAEIQITESNVLMPFVRMGVEAREQVVVGNSLEDLPVTRADHPMARYAEAFTRNFDLIAERKSVIYHLRDLAKAAALAKFMLDAGIDLDQSWFSLAQNRDIPRSLEVPQLWNNRDKPEIQFKETGINTSAARHGVFGGVQFGLDKFNLSKGVARSPAVGLSSMPRSAAAGLSVQTGSLTRMSSAPMRRGTSLITSGAAPAVQLGPMVKQGGIVGPAGGFAASLLAKGSTQKSLKMGAGRAIQPGASVTPIVVGAQGAPVKLPGVGKPLIPGRLTGLSGSFSAAGLLAQPPDAAPSLPQRLTFGLTRAPELSALSLAPPAVPKMATPSAPLSASISAGAPGMAAPLSAAVVAPRLGAMASIPRLQAAMQQSAAVSAKPADVPGAPQLQGVDLRLDNFDLSSAKRVSMEALEGSWGGEAQSLDKCVALGEEFWSSLDQGSGPFSGEDKTLLQSIFHPELCDRRMEGDCFTPPDATFSYVQKLRTLIKDEEGIREMRKDHFLSRDFAMAQPGPLFPASWSGMPVRLLAERPRGALHERPDYKGETAAILLSLTKELSPVFDNRTEEGLRFRIYQVGSLEVRTLQAVGGEEEIGVVFSVRALATKDSQMGDHIDDDEKITKATEYVERALAGSFGADCAAPYRYYLVLETEGGHKIVTERFMDGTASWDEDSADLDDRNSLAKMTRTRAASSDLTVRDMKAHHSTIVNGSSSGLVTGSICKRFARNLYRRAVGSSGEVVMMPARSARQAANARQVGRPSGTA